MKRFSGLVLVALLLVIPGLQAAENGYVTGTIVDVEEKAHTKVLYYIVNTPITRDDPYFEIQVQVKDRIYTGEYIPRHAADLLPDSWKTNAEVQVRLEKHAMFLKRPNGEDFEFGITRRTAVAPQTAPPKK